MPSNPGREEISQLPALTQLLHVVACVAHASFALGQLPSLFNLVGFPSTRMLTCFNYIKPHLTWPRVQAYLPPPFDQHAFWHYRTGCGLGLGPRPLPPYSNSINVGETLSLPTARCPLHPCPWGIEVWGLSYPTSGPRRSPPKAQPPTIYHTSYPVTWMLLVSSWHYYHLLNILLSTQIQHCTGNKQTAVLISFTVLTLFMF